MLSAPSHEGRASGGVPGITPPQTRHDVHADGGEDFFEACLYLDWDPLAWAALTSRLERAKAEAAAQDVPAPAEADLRDGAGGDSAWFVHPLGHRLGGGAGPMMRWKLQREGIVISLANRQTGADKAGNFTMPNCQVRFDGTTLLASDGAESLWRKVRGWLAELGATIRHDVVSRVDPCVDLAGVGLGDLIEAFADERVITRAKKTTDFTHIPAEVHRTGRKVTGLYIGKDTILRIYDKAEECRDPIKRALMEEKRWGGKPQDVATRIEFQLRRDFLKLRGVDTVADWFRLRASILAYLTTGWVRFVDEGFDRRHTNRARTLPIWEKIAAAFLAWARGKIDIPLSPVPSRPIDVRALVRQSRGCFERACAMLGVEVDGPDDFLGVAVELMHALVECDWEIPERVRRKRIGVD